MTNKLSLSRRTFVAATAAFAGAAASGVLGGCAGSLAEDDGAQQTQDTVEIKHCWCQMCGPARTHCSTLCTVVNGRWEHVEGNPAAGNNWGRGSKSLCAKGQAAMQTIYDPTRLRWAMKRVGPKGSGEFERCTWDEAIGALADKLKQLQDEGTPEALGVLSPQYFAVLATVGRRFMNVYGTPNYLHSAICNSQRVASKRISIGPTADCAPGQIDKCNLYVIWGANPENSAVNQGKPAAIVKQKARGMKLVDIRPMMDQLTSKADVWVPLRPGTDAALAYAILNVLIDEDLYDHDFVENWCSGFDELAEHVKQFTPAWASEKTGISTDEIYSLARLMGTEKPMGILYGNGVGDQQNDGNWEVVAINLIEAITGNLAIAGGGGASKVAPKAQIKLNAISVLSDRIPASAADAENGWTAGASKLVAPEFPRWYQNSKTWESGPTSAYYKGLMSIANTPEGQTAPLRCIIAQSTNPFGATRQPKDIVRALEKLEFYFVMDSHWNSSCDWADYVVPACSHYEAGQQIGVKNTAAGTFAAINERIQEPQGDAHSDWQFWLDLGVAMGFGDDFWNGDVDACLREQLEGSGTTLEELRGAEGGLFKEHPAGSSATEPKYQDYATLFAALPDGKVQCSNAWIGGKPNADGTGELGWLPEYSGPPEGIAETPELAGEYPLIMSDVHAYRLCEHSYYSSIPYLRELQPTPWVRINPATAKKYGIADGDWIRIESPHGWVKMTAQYFEGISPEVLMARRGWWQNCEELDLPGYGCMDGGSDPTVLYNTDTSLFDPFHSGMAKQTLVKISKYEGEK